MTIHNIGIVEDITYEFNRSLLCFFGATRQGKTTATFTALNLLRGGKFPPDILRHGTSDGFVQLDIEGGMIRREFYRDPEDGLTKAYEIIYTRDNSSVPIARPVEQLRALFGNPFNQNNDFLKTMGPTDRKSYFVELLNIDTGELDSEKKDIDDQNRMLQARIDGYGDISEEVVLPVDTGPIKAGIASKKREHASQIASWQTELDGLRLEWQSGKRKELQKAKNALEITNSDVGREEANIKRLTLELEVSQKNLALLQAQRSVQYDAVQAFTAEVSQLPDLTEKANALKAKIATPCDTSDLDAQLSEAAAQDVRVATYQSNLAKIEHRKHDNELLALNKERLKEIKTLKAQKLAAIAEESGIKGLSFDEEGDFLFEGVTNGLISSSQHQRLALELKNCYPETVPIEICDRAESLGVDIFKIIEGARERKSTILATIVGDRPALVPEDVGVWVVSNGKLMP
jgi:hypothetical protein